MNKKGIFNLFNKDKRKNNPNDIDYINNLTKRIIQGNSNKIDKFNKSKFNYYNDKLNK